MNIIKLTVQAPNNKWNVFKHFLQLIQDISSTDFNSLFKHPEPSYLTISPKLVFVIPSALFIVYRLLSFRDHCPLSASFYPNPSSSSTLRLLLFPVKSAWICILKQKNLFRSNYNYIFSPQKKDCVLKILFWSTYYIYFAVAFI